MATRDHGIFRRLDTPAPDSAKGGCYIYGGAGPCVDTGVLIDFEGTLTLGLAAIQELAEVAGFSVNVEGIQLEIENAELLHEVARLNNELLELQGQLNAIGVAVARAAAE